jgi:Transglycosylase SLT domain
MANEDTEISNKLRLLDTNIEKPARLPPIKEVRSGKIYSKKTPNVMSKVVTDNSAKLKQVDQIVNKVFGDSINKNQKLSDAVKENIVAPIQQRGSGANLVANAGMSQEVFARVSKSAQQTNILSRIEKFHMGPMAAYMRRDLALAYQRTIIAKDTLTLLKSLSEVMEGKLEAVKLNSSLSEHDKIGILGQLSHQVKADAVKTVSSAITSPFSKKISDVTSKYVANPLFNAAAALVFNPVTKRFEKFASTNKVGKFFKDIFGTQEPQSTSAQQAAAPAHQSATTSTASPSPSPIPDPAVIIKQAQAEAAKIVNKAKTASDKHNFGIHAGIAYATAKNKIKRTRRTAESAYSDFDTDRFRAHLDNISPTNLGVHAGIAYAIASNKARRVKRTAEDMHADRDAHVQTFTDAFHQTTSPHIDRLKIAREAIANSETTKSIKDGMKAGYDKLEDLFRNTFKKTGTATSSLFKSKENIDELTSFHQSFKNWSEKYDKNAEKMISLLESGGTGAGGGHSSWHWTDRLLKGTGKLASSAGGFAGKFLNTTLGIYGATYKAGLHLLSGQHNVVPFADVFRKDRMGPKDEPLVSKKEFERGLLFRDGRPVTNINMIDRPVINPADNNSEVISMEDLQAGLVDIYGKPVTKRKSHTSLLGLAGTTIQTGGRVLGKLIGASASVSNTLYKGVFGVLSSKSHTPFVDVYRKDWLVLGKKIPLVGKKDFEQGLLFMDGKPVINVSMIDRPVINPMTGNQVIRQEDIDAGLVDVFGKPISKHKASVGLVGAGLQLGMFGLKTAGSVAKSALGLGTPLMQMYSDLFKMGLKGIGSLGKGLSGMISNLFGRGKSGGFDKKDLYELVSKRLDHIYDLLEIRLPKQVRVGSYEDEEDKLKKQLSDRVHVEHGDKDTSGKNGMLGSLLSMFGGKDPKKEDDKKKGMVDELLEGGEQAAGWEATSLISSYLKKKFPILGRLATGASGLFKKIPGVTEASGLMGKLTPNFLKSGEKAAATGAEDIARMAAPTAGTAANAAERAVGSSASSAFGKEALNTTESIAGKEAAKLAEKEAGKEALKMGAKTIGKSLLKKIPIVAAFVGAGFAIDRALNGDFTGAVGELSSGLLATVPIVGTAGSIAIDSWLGYRDFKSGSSGPGAKSLVDKRMSLYGIPSTLIDIALSMEREFFVRYVSKKKPVSDDDYRTYANEFEFDANDPAQLKYFIAWFNNRFAKIFLTYVISLGKNGINYSDSSSISEDVIKNILKDLNTNGIVYANANRDLVPTIEAFNRAKDKADKSSVSTSSPPKVLPPKDEHTEKSEYQQALIRQMDKLTTAATSNQTDNQFKGRRDAIRAREAAADRALPAVLPPSQTTTDTAVGTAPTSITPASGTPAAVGVAVVPYSGPIYTNPSKILGTGTSTSSTNTTANTNIRQTPSPVTSTTGMPTGSYPSAMLAAAKPTGSRSSSSTLPSASGLSQPTAPTSGSQLITKSVDLTNLPKGSVGSGQCVALVQQAAGVGHTSTWHAGEKVLGNPNIKPGTPIAVFDEDGKYGNHTDGTSHAAIYLGPSTAKPGGIRVYDQWKGQAAHIRDIGPTGSKLVNNATAFRVIQNSTPVDVSGMTASSGASGTSTTSNPIPSTAGAASAGPVATTAAAVADATATQAGISSSTSPSSAGSSTPVSSNIPPDPNAPVQVSSATSSSTGTAPATPARGPAPLPSTLHPSTKPTGPQPVSSSTTPSSPDIKAKSKITPTKTGSGKDQKLGEGQVSIGGHVTSASTIASIQEAAKKIGIPPESLLAIANNESGFNAGIHAGTSSAAGLFQFIDSTQLGTFAKHGADVSPELYSKLPKDKKGNVVQDPSKWPADIKQQILALKTDPQAAAIMGAHLFKDTQDGMAKAVGRPMSLGDTYMGHFLGTGGGTKFLKAMDKDPHGIPPNPGANDSIYFKKGADGKPDHSQPRTYKEVYDLMTSRVNDTVGKSLLGEANKAIPQLAPKEGDPKPVAPVVPTPSPENKNKVADGSTPNTPSSSTSVANAPTTSPSDNTANTPIDSKITSPSNSGIPAQSPTANIASPESNQLPSNDNSGGVSPTGISSPGSGTPASSSTPSHPHHRQHPTTPSTVPVSKTMPPAALQQPNIPPTSIMPSTIIPPVNTAIPSAKDPMQQLAMHVQSMTTMMHGAFGEGGHLHQTFGKMHETLKKSVEEPRQIIAPVISSINHSQDKKDDPSKGCDSGSGIDVRKKRTPRYGS